MVDKIIDRFISREKKKIDIMMSRLPIDSYEGLEDIGAKLDKPLLKTPFAQTLITKFVQNALNITQLRSHSPQH